MTTKPDWRVRKVIDSMTLVTPGVRLLVLQVSCEEQDGVSSHHVSTYPVVALRGTLGRSYEKFSSSYIDLPSPNHDEILEAGWHFMRVDDEVEVLISVDEWDGGLATLDSISCCNCAERVIACPWPPAEDEERLKPHVACLLERAREKDRRASAPQPEGAAT